MMPSASQTIFKFQTLSDVVVFTPIPDDKWTQLLKVKTLQNCNKNLDFLGSRANKSGSVKKYSYLVYSTK